MLDCAAEEDRDVGRASTDIDDARAELLFVIGQHRVTRRQLLEDDVVDFEAAALYAFDDVLSRALGPCHHVHLRLEPHARHADGLADAFLAVDDEFLGQDMQNLLVGRDGNGARGIDYAIDIAAADLGVADRHDAVRIEAAYVAARDPGVHGVNVAAGHEFGFLDRTLD